MVHFDNNRKTTDYSNKEFELLEGYLDENIARITLAKFLYNNLGITFQLLTGIKLFPYQEIILRSWFDHNFNMNVWSRGASKSWLVAGFCCLYPIFNPGTKIVLAANALRATRRLILQIEKFINSKGAVLLRQCFTNATDKLEFKRHADELIMQVNSGSITALPLNEKLRGQRASILIVDEALQIPEDIYKSILMPFLTAKDNIQEQLEIKEIEDELVEQKIITEDERTVLESDKKIIALTSASYDFEFIYRLYMEWIAKITDPTKKDKEESKRTYFVSRLSYKSLPPELVEKEIVDEAASGGSETASFKREFMALFSSTSDGFFNVKRLHDNTVKPGDLPCVQLKGNKDSKYILAVDPNFSAASTSDLFGMGVYLLNDEERTITLVHSYGTAGGRLQDHIRYFFYLVSSFDPVFIIADLTGDGEGFNFIETCNQSAFFIERGMKLGFIDGDFNNDENYMEEVKNAKNSYNFTNKKIVYRQAFQKHGWLRKSNEYLQMQIDKNKIKFASPLAAHDSKFKEAEEREYPIIFDFENKEENNKINTFLDWVGQQDDYINQCKAQLALIEISIEASGHMKFDIPRHLKQSKSSNRARKDLYTCLLLATAGSRYYWDMIYEVKDTPKQQLAMPRSFSAAKNY